MNDLTLLYAEDEIETRKNYANYLKRLFKEVYVVANGKEALEVYEEKKPNIMLLDINMPFINGLELTKKIRVEDKNTRVIILTAHLEQDKLLFAAELNLTKYLPKPATRTQLKDALKEAVEQYNEISGEKETLELGEALIWNLNTKKLTLNDTDIKLTKHEISLFDLLTLQKDRVFSIEEISYKLWDDIDDLETSATKIKDIIKRLRKKLPNDTIENIYGVGYKLNF